jgi:hypothetical protein
MPATLAALTVGVIGSGSAEHEPSARAVGELLADLGVNLLTGGGGGVMTAVSRAFTQRPRTRGICIGIIPCDSESDRARPKAGYPNEFVELPIQTHLPYSGTEGTHDLSRNHINVFVVRGDCRVALAKLEQRLKSSWRSATGKPGDCVLTEPALVEHFPRSGETQRPRSTRSKISCDRS